MDDWDDIVAFCMTLPEVEMASFYGHPVPKLNGKALVSPGHEPGSFCLMATRAEKEILLETDPDAFWQTRHYFNYPALLVRYGHARDRVETHVRRRWWDVAKKAQRAASGPRP